jgi:hypothetical protein
MALDAMKQEWLRFKHDCPGERFENHRRRMTHAPEWHRVARVVGGVLLVLLGIAMCFLPGPGLLVILFGLALLAGISPWLARRMDHGEPRLRAWGSEAHRKWDEVPRRTRTVIATVSGMVLGLVLAGVVNAML